MPRPARRTDQAERAFAQAIADTESKKRATVASRKASQELLNAVAPAMPELLGGSADLTGSNLTDWKGHKPLLGAGTGNHVHYGVREFGMAAIMNGVALHGGFRPYGGTFLTFSDYSRNALRMSALMKLPVVHVFTHDSIGLGEDGPTHQPVEHVVEPAADSRPGRVAPGRCDRNSRGLARVAAPHRRPQRAGAQPPRPAARR